VLEEMLQHLAEAVQVELVEAHLHLELEELVVLDLQ
jgi:hypothetical protein